MYIIYYKIIRIMNGIYKYLIRNMWQAHLETACCSGLQIFQESPLNWRYIFPVINQKIYGLP